MSEAIKFSPAAPAAPTLELSKAERERQTAEAMMAGLRKRGVLGTPAGPDTSTADAVASALRSIPAAPVGREYVTQELYRRWVDAPAALTPDLHDEHCQSGQIIVGRDPDIESLACPVCRAAERAADLRSKLVAAGVDGRYLDVEWADLRRPAPLDRIAAGCEDILGVMADGESLLLWSEQTGSGKTQAAMLAAKAAIRAGRTAAVVNVARLAVDIRDGYGDRSGAGLKESAVRRLMTSPDLLVIDDLGAGETDSAAVERRLLFLALDERQTHKRSTIVTSNLDPRELAAIFGARIMARLSPLTIHHVDHGENFRLKAGRKSRW